MLYSFSRRLQSTVAKSSPVPTDISKVVSQGAKMVE